MKYSDAYIKFSKPYRVKTPIHPVLVESKRNDVLIYEVHSTIISRILGFRISRETRAHENPTKYRQSERAYSIFPGFGLAYARMNRSCVSQLSLTSLFAFASARVRRHRQSTPPPPDPGGHNKD